MKVLICGAGQVGFHIARYLAGENNDVTVLDQSPELIKKINNQLDVKAIVGQASYPDVLQRAGLDQADMLIAVTFADEVNMVACQIAHTIFNVPKKIARIRQKSYLDPRWAELFARDHMPIDVIISPEKEVADAIARRLRIPGAFDMFSMADDNILVVGAHCHEETPIVNTKLRQLTSLFPDLNVVIVALIRDGELIIPTATDQMLPGDDAYFVVDKNHIARTMAAFGHEEKESRRFVIFGGGNIGTYLAETLRESNHANSVRIIELDMLRARKVAEILPNINVIQGSVLETEILDAANIQKAEVVIAVTDNDETNILASLLAKRRGVKRAVTLVNSANYLNLVTTLGIDVVVSPREITASRILQQVRRGKIRSVNTIHDGTAEVIEAEIMETSALVGVMIREAKLPNGAIVGGILRDDDVIIPRPDTQFELGDRVIILIRTQDVHKLEKLFTVQLQYF